MHCNRKQITAMNIMKNGKEKERKKYGALNKIQLIERGKFSNIKKMLFIYIVQLKIFPKIKFIENHISIHL